MRASSYYVPNIVEIGQVKSEILDMLNNEFFIGGDRGNTAIYGHFHSQIHADKKGHYNISPYLMRGEIIIFF